MNILMPQLGETVAEGKITLWYKAVGDFVAAGESLFEIETDKTSMDVPTTEPGVLSEIRVPAGDTVPVGAVVAVIAESAEGTAVAARAAATGADAANERAAAPIAAVTSAAPARKAAQDPFNPVRTPARNYGSATRAGGVKVTPVARRLAVEAGVELNGLVGSGPHGHVVAKDVRAAAESRERAARGTQVRAGAPDGHAGAADGRAGAAHGRAAGGTAVAESLSTEQIKAQFQEAPFDVVPLDNMRRTIARRLLEAKQSIPHFYLDAEVALGRLIEVRNELNAQAAGAFKASINDFIIRAVALALQRVPEANAVWANDCILRLKHSDVAVAVAVEGGLFAPVIRQAELKSLRAVSKEMQGLIERARGRALKPDDYRGGSITISNLGMYGVRSFSAIVNPPQAAILAIGAAERRAVEAADGSVRFASVVSVTLSCDHRVIDGVLGAQLLAALKALLEAPLLLLA